MVWIGGLDLDLSPWCLLRLEQPLPDHCCYMNPSIVLMAVTEPQGILAWDSKTLVVHETSRDVQRPWPFWVHGNGLWWPFFWVCGCVCVFRVFFFFFPRWFVGFMYVLSRGCPVVPLCSSLLSVKKEQLDPPVVPFYPFLGEGSPTKIDQPEKTSDTNLFYPLYWRTLTKKRTTLSCQPEKPDALDSLPGVSF